MEKEKIGQSIYIKIHNKMIDKKISRDDLAKKLNKKRNSIDRNFHSLRNNQGSLKVISEICEALNMKLVIRLQDKKKIVRIVDKDKE